MPDKLNETLRLLRDNDLIWSADFEAVRLPLADLLERLYQTGSHQFDDDVEALHKALTEGTLKQQADSTDPTEAWVAKSAWAFGVNASGRIEARKLYGF